MGSEFQVNSYTTNLQGFPAVAGASNGNFVVAWESLGSSGTDTDDRSIQAQRYRLPVVAPAVPSMSPPTVFVVVATLLVIGAATALRHRAGGGAGRRVL